MRREEEERKERERGERRKHERRCPGCDKKAYPDDSVNVFDTFYHKAYFWPGGSGAFLQVLVR